MLKQHFIFVWKNLHITLQLGPYAHQLHFTSYDIYELRQLVQLVFTQEAADSGNPQIFRHCQRAHTSGVWNHAAKLEQAEFSKILSYARLGKEDGTSVIEFDCRGDGHKKRREASWAQRGASHVTRQMRCRWDNPSDSRKCREVYRCFHIRI